MNERIAKLEKGQEILQEKVDKILSNDLPHLGEKIDKLPEKFAKIFVIKGRFKPVEWFTYAIMGGGIAAVFTLIVRFILTKI